MSNKELTQRSERPKSHVPNDEADTIEILPMIAMDLKSTVEQLHLPGLKRLINIVLKGSECLDEFYSQDMPSILKKFLNPKSSDERFAITTTILHIVGVIDKVSDETIRANAAIEPLIQMIHSTNEGRSRAACMTLWGLVDDDAIRASLLSNGFLGTVQHTLTQNINVKIESQKQELKSTSSSSSKGQGSNHVQLALLDILLKLSEEEEGLQPLAFLIPVLEELKNNGQGKLKNKAKKVLSILNDEGITAYSAGVKEKDEKIQQLENTNKRLEEDLRRKEEDKQNLKEENQKQKDEIEKLKLENEKLKPKLPQDLTFTNICADPQDFVSSTEGNGQVRITKKKDKHSTMSLSPVLENGVYALEAQFVDGGQGYNGIGIVRDSYNIPDSCAPWSAVDQAFYQNTLEYADSTYSGSIFDKGGQTAGNTNFTSNQIVKAEYDSEKGTLVFFCGGSQQPVYVTGIKEKIRFAISMCYTNSYCVIRSFKKLAAPTSGHVANEKSIQW